MELYPHNRNAYESAIRIFQEKNETCIIHPTGTGKAVIIGKFIFDNPEAKHLVLAPGKHIFNEIGKHCNSKNVRYRTYQGIKSAEIVQHLAGLDYIYLDEFHRIGAEKWGPRIFEIIEANPAAKLLGTTATHIRFLDGQRDMASEIFKNSIASYISLSRAFMDGILWSPKYVNALYSIDEEFRLLAAKIKGSNSDDKKLLVSELRGKVLNWKQTSGIDTILKKHLPNSRKRIIVFCNGLREMRSADLLLMPILQQIFSNPLSLHVHSLFKTSHNTKAIQAFRDQDNITKILFTVDKMNEGLHGKDISVAILMRKTSSPIIFYQQIGRCFSIGQTEQPIIFDLVNNFKNTQVERFKSDHEHEVFDYSRPVNNDNKTVSGINTNRAIIEFLDETQGIRSIFKEFENRIESWEIYFRQAEAFCQEFGHLYVPKKSRSLYNWIYFQRLSYKENSLEKEKIERLTALGMDWMRSIDDLWIRNYDKLKKIVETNGGEPAIINDLGLYEWLRLQRKKFAKGKLNESYKTLLTTIISLEQPRTKLWNEKLRILKEHKEQHGTFNLTQKDPIYKIIINVRAAYNNGTLPNEALNSLKNMGLPLKSSRTWEESFKMLQDYKNEHGRFPTVADNNRLAGWMHHQRYQYGKKKLKKDYVEPLIKLGVIENQTYKLPCNGASFFTVAGGNF